MSVKIRDLTVEKMQEICDKWHKEQAQLNGTGEHYMCDNCPFKLVSIKNSFLQENWLSKEMEMHEESYSYCLLNLATILDREIEDEL